MSERERLLAQERRAKQRAESEAVARGVAETVQLERGRGAAFERPEAMRGGRETPYRRQPGLDWLARKGRISAAQKSAGERYRDAFRIAQPEVSLGSTLEVQPGMGSGGPPLRGILAKAGARHAAEQRLAAYRRRLSEHPALIAACDLICGRELTPREAAADDREALKLEAVLVVALDLLTAA